MSFVKPIGLDNKHPSYATVARGQQHLAQLVDTVRNSPVWADTLIVITYDDNGGEWDHVARQSSIAGALASASQP